MSPKLEKVALKPINLALGIGAGALAGLVFKQVWKLASGDDDAPDAGVRPPARAAGVAK